ncbi:MAG TPA: protein kinase [Polyangiaceae bacterium]|nr:protein kinase [Polyangiaceae bacterium]
MRPANIAVPPGGRGDEACFDDERAVAYVEGRASAAERARIERHASGCAECRVVLSELARAAAGAGAGPPEAPARGTRVGRYVVLSPLGAGAMGVVYAAFDPELERKIALKLLAPEASEAGEARAERLRREAQAMARVSHENVVPVFDVGTWAGQLFVAMELVDGQPLSRWCREAERPRAAVLARLLEAGRGLEAAHRAGLVHRDFKPDNVLVSATRGARVSDFGLSRLGSERPASRPEAPAGLLVSGTRELVGTPAYMAPEQLRGERADARSDQFAFCVTAYEALYGERPFQGETIEALLRAVEAGPPAPPVRRGVPLRVRHALARGLSAAPERRFASMGELLAAMRPRRPRALTWAALGVGALGSTLGLVGLLSPPAPGRSSPCEGAERHLAGVWDDASRAGVRAALEGLGPVGRDAWPRVEASFDRRARAWVAAHGEACRATYVHREQSERVLALRYACLDRRLAEMGALGQALAGADAASARRAAEAAEGLEGVGQCADVAALLGPEPPPAEPARREEAQAVGRELERGKALYSLGRYREAADLAAGALGRARALGHRPLEAQALFQLGMARTDLDDLDAAEAAAVDAYRVADAGRDDATKARAAGLLSSLVGRTPARTGEGLRWSDLGFAALARAGGANAPIEALLLANRGFLLMQDAARADEAAEVLGRALEAGVRAGVTAPSRARSVHQLGVLRTNQRRYDEALALFEHSCELTVGAVGPDHPDVGYCEEGIGNAYAELGDLGRAREHFERAYDVSARAFGATSTRALAGRLNACLALWRGGERGPAIACQRELYRTALGALGRGHEITAGAAVQLASFLAESSPREARGVLAANPIAPDQDEILYGVALSARGRAQLASGERRAAGESLRRSVALLANDPSSSHELAEAQRALARALAPTSPAARARPRRGR